MKLLQPLDKLQILDLYGNKVSDAEGYRKSVYKMFPKLVILDSEDEKGNFDETTTSLVAQRVNSNLIDKSQLNKLSKAQQEVIKKVSSHNLQPRTQSIKVIKQNSKLGKQGGTKMDEEKKSTEKAATTTEAKPAAQKKTETKPTKPQKTGSGKLGGKGKTDMQFSKRKSQSVRSGLVFPCGRIGRYLKQSFPNFRQSCGSKVYIAAVLEYLAAEIMELAGNYSKEAHKSRIQPIHIKYAMRNDDELSKFLSDIILSEGGGVQTHFQLPILQKKQKKDEAAEGGDQAK